MNTSIQKPRVLFSSPYNQGAKRPAELSQPSQESSDELNGEDAQDNSDSPDEGEGNEKIDGIMLSLDDDEKMQLFDTLTQYFKSKDNEDNKDEVDVSDLTPQEES